MPYAMVRDAPSLGTQPDVTLVRWIVFELPSGSRHFCGIHKGDDPYRGRVSTGIVGFDPETSTGRTESGRIYRLEGPPGEDDAVVNRLLRMWLASNGMSPDAGVPIALDELGRLLPQ